MTYLNLILDPTPVDTNLTIIAKDTDDQAVNATFHVLYVANSPPTVTSATTGGEAQDNVTFSYSVDLTTVFTDTDLNQTLTYAVSNNVPSYMMSTFHSNFTFEMSGTPSVSNIGSTIITFT